jgi:hypothetical protein
MIRYLNSFEGVLGRPTGPQNKKLASLCFGSGRGAIGCFPVLQNNNLQAILDSIILFATIYMIK